MFDGRKAKELRVARGWTVMDLVARLYAAGHPRSMPTVRKWEAGRIQPRTDDLAALARVLGVEVQELLQAVPRHHGT